MQINLEKPEPHTIQSYSETQVMVNNTLYRKSVIIDKSHIIPDWSIQSINELDENTLEPLLQLKPEVILIGFTEPNSRLPFGAIAYAAKQRVGLECMSIGAASRTFNLLLSEGRDVVLGIVTVDPIEL